ncbi:alpha-amylase family glycosyl hydrolase [Balneola sp. MJW-20]|uniref:alpha-amylase family glycosyl hydrolase n=1 Tax=Gracilimonas aurantiaca TaxID=3234185 RepID=UPI0034656748
MTFSAKKISVSAISLALLFVLNSCSVDEPSVPNTSELLGLASPVMLEYSSTEILLQDYFIDPVRIDSLTVPEGLEAIWNKEEASVVISGELPVAMDLMKVYVEGYEYSIPLKRSEKYLVQFRLDPGEERYDRVQLKGEMNSWNPNATELEFVDGIWTTEMHLNRGIFQYLFVADGEEVMDPENEERVSNGMGGFNSLLTVGDQDIELPELFTNTYNGRSISLRADLADDVIVLWENYALPVNKTDDFYSINIPAAAKNLNRSHIRAWGYNEDGIGNDVLIPLENGTVLDESSDLERTDWYNWNMYFVLIDRFKDGNPSNTRKLNSPEVDPRVDYYGGDLAGITQKIKDGYFEQMGVNTIWLSPISQNPDEPFGYWDQGGPETKFSGYHGYWPVSSSRIDDRFGTEAEFRELLDVAHSNGMNVILDYVANHVHQDHPVYQQHKDWATNLYLPDGSLNTQLWDQQRLTTWFDTFMPTLDFSKPEVVDTMTDSALFWVQNYDLDGFRHDATKHIQLDFWRTLTRKVKDEITIPTGKRVYQIGETYGSRELIASYINTGMLDAQFDFSLFDSGQNTFGKGDSFKGLEAQLQESFNYYGYHNLMGYISGNHDKPRFISLTSGEVKWDEDGKIAGWTREIERPQSFAYDRLLMFHAFNQTIPGIPVTYQGDEYGQPGANDPDNRRWMQFDEEELTADELRTRNTFQTLTGLRNDNLELTYGDFIFHSSGENTMAYSRAYFDHISYVIFNKADKDETIEIDLREGFDHSSLDASFANDFEVRDNKLSITLSANSFEILTLN